MNELLFFGIIALFTILEGIARSKKKREREAHLPVPEEWEVGRDVEAEAVGAKEEYISVLDRSRRKPPEDRPSPTPSSSEDLIPADIWEEITALARGEVPARRAPPAPPQRPPPVPRPERPPPAAPTERIPAPSPEPHRPSKPHRLHATHPRLGRPVQERLTRLDEPADHDIRANPDIVDVREMLAGGRSSLRRAVLLREVLGPPVAMRDDPLETRD